MYVQVFTNKTSVLFCSILHRFYIHYVGEKKGTCSLHKEQLLHIQANYYVVYKYAFFNWHTSISDRSNQVAVSGSTVIPIFFIIV